MPSFPTPSPSLSPGPPEVVTGELMDFSINIPYEEIVESRTVDLENRVERLKGGHGQAFNANSDAYDAIWSSITDTGAKQLAKQLGIGPGKEWRDPKITIPRIIDYLRNNEKIWDVRWADNLNAMDAYVQVAERRQENAEFGALDPQLAANIEEARRLIGVHRYFDGMENQRGGYPNMKTLEGPLRPYRLLPYPRVFPQPEPNRARISHKRLPGQWSGKRKVFNATSLLLAASEIDVTPLRASMPVKDMTPLFEELHRYVRSENKFFRRALKSGSSEPSQWPDNQFEVENREYERLMLGTLRDVLDSRPQASDDIGHSYLPAMKPPAFYKRRGWQRAALQKCLNMFTNEENRHVNTPWTRIVLPYTGLKEPNEVVYHARALDPKHVPNDEKDPSPWLHWSNQHTQLLEYLAGWQRRRYNKEHWGEFSRSALPLNFRGPTIYRGLSIYEDHWLRIGEHLSNLFDRMVQAWGAAPRPLMLAVLRDVVAGRTRGDLPTPDHERRSTVRRPTIDQIQDEDYTNKEGPAYIVADNAKLIDEHDIAWLQFLCEPSRSDKMCDPEVQPQGNLLRLFDTRLQAFLRNVYESGTPGRRLEAELLWNELPGDADYVLANQRMPTLPEALAYINGCDQDEILFTGPRKHFNPVDGHPNKTYQFSEEEAEYYCMQLQKLDRCTFLGNTETEPSLVGRPRYTLHPEDRVHWRYIGPDEWRQADLEYRNDMSGYYAPGQYGDLMLNNSVDRMTPRAAPSWHTWPQPPENDDTSEWVEYERNLSGLLDHIGPHVVGELVDLERIDPRYRRVFVERYLMPQMSFVDADSPDEDMEAVRGTPYFEDLAPWELVGQLDRERRKRVKDQKAKDAAKADRDEEGWEVFGHLSRLRTEQVKTPEKTAQFFRNLGYRMGCTLRHWDKLKARLEYDVVQDDAQKKPVMLDLSAECKSPRPAAGGAPALGETGKSEVVVKMWHPISPADFRRETRHWNEVIAAGLGEVPFLPPKIDEVLDRADPSGWFRQQNPTVTNPYDLIRLGNVRDCERNRSVLYPGRVAVFKDQQGGEFQGPERPRLWAWATDDQRRYQAPYTREHFFGVDRWPLEHLDPARRAHIMGRHDEGLRVDPTLRNQTLGILTYRVPVAEEIEVHAHTRDRPWPASAVRQREAADRALRAEMERRQMFQPTTTAFPVAGAPPQQPAAQAEAPTAGSKDLVPFSRPRSRYIPGPVVFAAGETLLQQTMISRNLEMALYPEPKWFQGGVPGTLGRVWRRFTETAPPRIPLLPEIPRSEIPRSNPRKRRVPDEFRRVFSPKKPRHGGAGDEGPRFPLDDEYDDDDDQEGGGGGGSYEDMELDAETKDTQRGKNNTDDRNKDKKAKKEKKKPGWRDLSPEQHFARDLPAGYGIEPLAAVIADDESDEKSATTTGMMTTRRTRTGRRQQQQGQQRQQRRLASGLDAIRVGVARLQLQRQQQHGQKHGQQQWQSLTVPRAADLRQAFDAQVRAQRIALPDPNVFAAQTLGDALHAWGRQQEGAPRLRLGVRIVRKPAEEEVKEEDTSRGGRGRLTRGRGKVIQEAGPAAAEKKKNKPAVEAEPEYWLADLPADVPADAAVWNIWVESPDAVLDPSRCTDFAVLHRMRFDEADHFRAVTAPGEIKAEE
ncbi:hypothetical protein GGR56DRAFT_696001 [Xylariaceae sp. FL0804]|nr:hypothetical protein GGR56DRAFT_696001 [Xylariaceae sp. FL0804]